MRDYDNVYNRQLPPKYFYLQLKNRITSLCNRAVNELFFIFWIKQCPIKIKVVTPQIFLHTVKKLFSNMRQYMYLKKIKNVSVK